MLSLPNNLKEMLSSDKKTKIIAGVVALLLVAGGAYYLFGLHDNGGRADQVRDNLQSVGEQQQRAGEAVRDSKQITERIRETNTIIEREVDRSRELNKSSSELITEGKRIFQTVRERK